jgi:long-chain acyl-CoA synthetase
MLNDASQTFGNVTALVHEDRRLTYTEYVRCVAGLARKLQSFSNNGSLRGERIALVCGNSLEMAVGLFAAHASGSQIVPLNPMYTMRELRYILSDAQPLIVIYDVAIGEVIQQLLEELDISHSIGIGGSVGEYFDIWRDNLKISLPEMPNPDDFATLQYTGGTTGLPKGVDITHRQLSINISQREDRWPTREGVEKVLCVMPLFHVYASSMALHLAVYCKSCLYILTHYRPDTVLHTITTDRISLLPVGPTIFSGLMAFEKFMETDFSSLRISYSGSAPLSADTLMRWKNATGCAILEGYGQSEAGPVISAVAPGSTMIVGSVGQPLVDTVVQIVDLKNGTEVLGVGKQGEIRVKGPQVMSGYRNRPTETRENLRDNWLYTGDIGELDDQGNLFIRDRKKDMIIVGGYNVYPREIDEVLYSHPDVSEVAAVGVSDDYKGEVVYACVSLRDGSTISSSDLIRFCDKNLAKYKVPKKIEIYKEIPKTTVGKVDKAAVRDMFRTMSKSS